MKILIDTHALIWHMEGNKRLGKKSISAIEDTGNIVFVSKASLWEMAIKISLGKLEISVPFEELEAYLEENDFTLLDFQFKDMKKLISLPFHHGDPFDRMIISQAIADELIIITHDEAFEHYGVEILK